jgi:hypothetical protein
MGKVVNGLLDQVYVLLMGLLIVLIIWTIIHTYFQRRSWVAAAGMALGGALVLWIAVNLVSIGELVDQTVDDANSSTEPENLPDWEDLQSDTISGSGGGGGADRGNDD